VLLVALLAALLSADQNLLAPNVGLGRIRPVAAAY
jgi:hypothetical protein